MRGFWVKHRQH